MYNMLSPPIDGAARLGWVCLPDPRARSLSTWGFRHQGSLARETLRRTPRRRLPGPKGWVGSAPSVQTQISVGTAACHTTDHLSLSVEELRASRQAARRRSGMGL